MIRIGQRPRRIVLIKAPLVKPEWRGIVEEELTRYQVSWNDLISTSRMKHIVAARWTIFRRLDCERGATCSRMAKQFSVHHTTVLNALGRLSGNKRAKR